MNNKLEYELEYPKKSSIVYPKEKLYREKTIVRTDEYKLDDTISFKDNLKNVFNEITILTNKMDKMVKDFLMLKIFMLSANRDEKFNKEFEKLDKFMKKFRDDINIVKRFYNSFEENTEENFDGLVEIFNAINNLYDFSDGLNNDINKFRKKYYNEFKLTSFAIVKDKSIDQLEDLNMRIEKELLNYKNIEDANDYIIYHSGCEIMKVVNEFVNSKTTIDVNIPYHYFLSTDDIICFTYNEWIDLFVKFKYVIEKLGDNLLFDEKFLNDYRLLETRYAIVTIYNEKLR